MSAAVQEIRDELTSLERVGLALQYKKPDRVPAAPLVCGASSRVLGYSYARWSQDPKAAAASLLAKCDISSPHAVARLRERLAALNPSAPLTVANHGAVDAGWLLRPANESAVWAHAKAHAGHDHRNHSHGIRSVCLWFGQPLDEESFWRAMTDLTETHGERLLRIKGLLNLAGAPRPVAIHGIGNILHPLEPLSEWTDADRRSRVVFIADRLGEAEIAPFFVSFAPIPARHETHSDFEAATL
jgi:G3E family GTPase